MNPLLEIEAIKHEPLAIVSTAFANIEMAARSAINSRSKAGPYGQRDRTISRSSGGIATIPITGVITQHRSIYSMLGFGTSTTEVTQALRAALDDDSVTAIVLDVDSPGGSVYGVEELAREIYASRAVKRIVAVASGMAASAAYWLASNASEFYASPSSEVGSIGVVQSHSDVSEMLKQQGVHVTLISAGKHKVEGNPFEPLGKEAQDFLQTRTNEYYASFTRSVARGRNVSVEKVRTSFGQGRLLGAAAGRAAGMIDGIMTMDQVVRQLKGRPQNKPSGGSDASRRYSTRTAYELARLRLLH